MRIIIIVLSCLLSWSALADNTIAVKSGNRGNLVPNKIYQISFSCEVNSEALHSFANRVFYLASETVAISVALKSQSVVGSGSTASSNTILNVPFIVYERNGPGIQSKKTDSCNGKLFVNGDEDFILSAAINMSNEATLADFVDRLAGVIVSGADAIYPLVRKKQPERMEGLINNSEGTIKAFATLLELFKLEIPTVVGAPVPLKVGQNSIDVIDQWGRLAVRYSLTVRGIEGFLKSDNEKYLSAYFEGMTVNSKSLDLKNIRTSCEQARSDDRMSGFSDDLDAVYLLYRRLLTSSGINKEVIVECMGSRALAIQAVDLLKKRKSTLAPIPERTISELDVDDVFPAYPPSSQPHGRAVVAKEMSNLSALVGRHLQGAGLLNPQLQSLTSKFTVPIEVEDQTTDYVVLKTLAEKNITEPAIQLSAQDFLSKLKVAGLLRWGCVQGTKRSEPSSAFYDPEIDSAVLVLVARAKADDSITIGKTPIYAVHVLFKPTESASTFTISKLVFDDRYVAKVLAANAKCFER